MRVFKRLGMVLGILSMTLTASAFADGYKDRIVKIKNPDTYFIGKNKVELVEDYKIEGRGTLFEPDFEFMKAHYPSSYDKETQNKSIAFKNKVARAGYWINKYGYYVISETNYDEGNEDAEDYKSAMQSMRFKLEYYSENGNLEKVYYYYVRPSAAINDDSWIHLRGYNEQFLPEFYGAFVKILDDKTIILDENETEAGASAKILKWSNKRPIPVYEDLIIPYMEKNDVDEITARGHYTSRQTMRRSRDKEVVPPNVVKK